MSLVPTMILGRSMDKTDELLDFMLSFSKEALQAGATVEYVEKALKRISQAYEMKEMSSITTSNFIVLSARPSDGMHHTRQTSIEGSVIHLAKLWHLNHLRIQVCENTPAPKELMDMLGSVFEKHEFPKIITMPAQVIAFTCICILIGGSVRDALATVVCATAVCVVFEVLNHFKIDAIVSNALGMFVATCITIFAVRAGFGDSGSMVVITISLMMIPGIPLANAFSSLVRGNEMNGSLLLVRVTLESLMLALGTYAAVLLLGGLTSW